MTSLNILLQSTTSYKYPYLTYTQSPNNTLVVRNLDELSYLDQRIQMCFVKYHDHDSRGFLMDEKHRETILKTITPHLSSLEHLWVQEPIRWFLPIPVASSLTEMNPQITNPPFNLKRSKDHIVKTLATLKLDAAICFSYIPFSGLISIQECSTVQHKLFVNCFSENRGMMIDKNYQDEILPYLPYILTDRILRPALNARETTKPFFMGSVSIKDSFNKMYKNTQKALTEHLDALNRRKDLNKNYIVILGEIGINLFSINPSAFDVSPLMFSFYQRLLKRSGIPCSLNILKDLCNKVANAKENQKSLNTFILELQQEIEFLNNSGYISKEQLPSIQTICAQAMDETQSPLDFTWGVSSEQGYRKSMEDAHFFKEFKGGIITGVFDGHGGSDVADYASQEFEKKFPMRFAENRDPLYSFTTLIQEINQEIFKNPEWDKQGSTALICFIDKKTQLIYTATIGDSEANIYRKTDDGLYKSIPLSCVRDWSSEKDAKRAADYYNEPDIALTWLNDPYPKKLRLNRLNLSRSLGDLRYGFNAEGKAGIISKPKVTIQTLLPNDILILACDGLKDYVPEKNIVDLMNTHSEISTTELASLLTTQALDTFSSQDNVTVLVLKCM